MRRNAQTMPKQESDSRKTLAPWASPAHPPFLNAYQASSPLPIGEGGNQEEILSPRPHRGRGAGGGAGGEGAVVAIMHNFGNKLLLLFIVFPSLYAQDPVKRDHPQMHSLHLDPKAYIAILEDPQRDAYQKPHEVVMALALKDGEVVADIGAGSGYFSFRLSHHVGERGRVCAVDISPDMILHMNRRIRELGVKNVITVLAPSDDPLLPDASVDRFFICDTWHHVEKQEEYLKLMKKMLKPGGQIIMIDFQKRDLPVGPPMDMKIAREDLIRQMELAGFGLAKEHTFLPYQYFLVFTPR